MICLFHKTVLLNEVIDFLKIIPGQWYLDGTLGDGGHSLKILKKGGKLVGIDTDPQALRRATDRFLSEGIAEDRYLLIEGNFRDLKSLLLQKNFNNPFSGIVFDFGVSTYQLETAERGFSFRKTAPLDMRMSPKLSVKALDLINGLYENELVQLFEKYGEEPKSKMIAKSIVAKRPISTTTELADLVKYATRDFHGKIHPATRIFQALRVAVNDELAAIENVLPQALDLLCTDGKLAVISFHSLEDRIVKNTFKMWKDQQKSNILTKKPLTASEKEIEQNPASRSAKLRVAEKI